MPIARRLRSLVPESIKRRIRRLVHRGGANTCPVCGSSVEGWLPYGNPPRRHARCPICGALERHRLAWWYLAEHTDLLVPPAKRLLHFAPERSWIEALSRLDHLDHITADLVAGRAAAALDVTDLGIADGRIDVVICNHVLEHVPDDRRAMAELHRVLRSDGWALVMVPLQAAPTIEDPDETDPAERLERFGQIDHVRRYGPDIADRFRSVGFAVERLTSTTLLSKEQRQQLGVRNDYAFFVLRR